MAQQFVDLVLQAVATLQSPTAQLQQRKEATLFIEQVKKGDVHVLLAVGGTLVAAHLPLEVRVVGFSLLTDLAKLRWAELAAVEKAQLSQLSMAQATAVLAEGRTSRPLKGKAAVLLSSLIRQQGTEAYASVVPQLVHQAGASPAQAELACMVLHYISEDLNQFELDQGDGKRQFIAALTASVSAVFPFLCESLQQHFVAAVAAQQEGATERLAAHSAVITAALGALSAWVEWTPMSRITASNALDACAFFLPTREFRLTALDVLKAVASRRRTNEPWAEYALLIDKLATLLLARATELGLMVAPGQLPEALRDELDWGGDLEEVGRRLCALLCTLCETHLRCLAGQEKKLQLLQLLLVLTAHPYLQLPAAALPVWAQIIREAAPGSGASTTGNNSALHGLPAHALAEVLGSPALTVAAVPPVTLPPEVCQVLLQVLWQLLTKVVPQAESVSAAFATPPGAATAAAAASAPANGASGLGPAGTDLPERSPSSTGLLSMPAYFDSHQEWKEFSLMVRGHAKVVLRATALVAPTQALALMAQVLSQAMASALSAVGGPAPGAMPTLAPAALAALVLPIDCAVHVVEATLPPLLEAASGSGRPYLVDELCQLLASVMAVRFTVPRLVTLQARCLEAFGKLLTVRPELVVPLVTTSLESMLALPMPGPAQAPPPAKITRAWKQTSEARLSLANTVAQYAKVAPAAFEPHLRALADQVAAMWDARQLTEGERVLLWEGLLAAAAGVSGALAGQLAGWLLAPMAQLWSTPAWQARLASPEAFIQAFLPVETIGPATPTAAALPMPPAGTPAQVHVGARAERWALYHQLTLLERAMRRTAPPRPPGPSGPHHDGTAASTSMGAEGPDTRPSSPPPSQQMRQQPVATAAVAAAVWGDYPMDAHLKWCLPAIAAIMQCVHSLSAANAAGVLGPLQGLTALDEMDKVSRVVGEDPSATGGRDSKEPRCVAGGAVADGRYFLRGLREATGMIVSLAMMHGSPAALWSDAALAAAITSSTTAHLQFLDHNHVRLLIRHVGCQICSRCPAAYQPAWVLPLLSALLPHMAARLSAGWQANTNAEVAAAATTAVAASGGGGGAKEGRSQQDVDEVVGDVLLREATREHMALLLAATQRPTDRAAQLAALAAGAPAGGTPSGSGGRKQPLAMRVSDALQGSADVDSNSGPALNGSVGRQAPGPRVSNHGSGSLVASPALGGGAVDVAEGVAGVVRDTPFGLLMAQQPELAQVFISTAISGLCWPDIESAGKAAHVCKFIVQVGLRQDAGFVTEVMVGPLLQAAVVALAQPFAASVQGDLLALLRQLLVGALALPGLLLPRVRETLVALLQVPEKVVRDFEVQLASKGSEKEQRATIRQLVAQAGGDEVRKILELVSRVPPASASQQQQRRQAKAAAQHNAAAPDTDALLQGALFNAVFADE